jgi:hypothetical protein
MAKYSIEDTTLTSIADAIREKDAGRIVIHEILLDTRVSKTSNATGFDTYEGVYEPNLDVTDTITFEGADFIVIDIACHTDNSSYDYVQVKVPGETVVKMGGTSKRQTLRYEGTNTVDLYFHSNSSNSSASKTFLGYYAEVKGYKYEYENKETNTYKPSEMPEAIKDLRGSENPLYIELNSGSTYTPRPSLSYTDTVCESCGLWYHGIGSTGSAQSTSAWRWRKKSKSDIWPMVYWPANNNAMSENTEYRLVFYIWCSPGKTVEWASNNIYFNEHFSTTHNLGPITESKQRIDITFTYKKSSSSYEPCLHMYPLFANTDEDTLLFMSAPIFFQADYANSGCELPY